MAISIQLPSHQLATPIFSQMAAKAYGCLNESEAVGSGWVLEGRKGARTPLPKTTRDTILGNAPGQEQTKKSRETLALRDLTDPKSKGWFPLYMNVWLFSGPKKTRRNWMVGPCPPCLWGWGNLQMLYKWGAGSSCFSSNLVDSLSPYNELKEKRSLAFLCICDYESLLGHSTGSPEPLWVNKGITQRGSVAEGKINQKR